MLARILRKFGEAEEKVCFDNLMKTVRTICLEKKGEVRRKALQDLQTIVLRPVQDEFIRSAYLYPEDNAGRGPGKSLDFFACLGLRQSQLDSFGATYKREAPFNIEVASNLIFAKVVSGLNTIGILGTSGSDKNLHFPHSSDSSNQLLWVEPFRFGFAMSSQLQIALEIVNGKGILQPESILDLTPCLDKISFDGAHFLGKDNIVLGKPITPEFGWSWEIQKRGRLGPPQE